MRPAASWSAQQKQEQARVQYSAPSHDLSVSSGCLRHGLHERDEAPFLPEQHCKRLSTRFRTRWAAGNPLCCQRSPAPSCAAVMLCAALTCSFARCTRSRARSPTRCWHLHTKPLGNGGRGARGRPIGHHCIRDAPCLAVTRARAAGQDLRPPHRPPWPPRPQPGSCSSMAAGCHPAAASTLTSSTQPPRRSSAALQPPTRLTWTTRWRPRQRRTSRAAGAAPPAPSGPRSCAPLLRRCAAKDFRRRSAVAGTRD